MSTLDLRYYDEVTGQWEAPLANGVDLDALEVLLGQHFNATNPHNVTKSQVGLANVDNTSDVDKPISTATQQALAGKADANSLAPIYQEIDAVEQTLTTHLGQIGFQAIVYLEGTQTVPSGDTPTIVNFNTKVVDPLNMWDAVGRKFVIPAGVKQVRLIAKVEYDVTAPTRIGIAFTQNGTSNFIGNTEVMVDAISNVISSRALGVDVGAKYSLVTYQNTSGALDLRGGSTKCWFALEVIK